MSLANPVNNNDRDTIIPKVSHLLTKPYTQSVVPISSTPTDFRLDYITFSDIRSGVALNSFAQGFYAGKGITQSFKWYMVLNCLFEMQSGLAY